jgi:hypothetical protein
MLERRTTARTTPAALASGDRSGAGSCSLREQVDDGLLLGGREEDEEEDDDDDDWVCERGWRIVVAQTAPDVAGYYYCWANKQTDRQTDRAARGQNQFHT